jgi:Domain of unknown function DUF11
MNSILSAISGNFSKSLILSTFLPTVLFVILNLVLTVPLLPPWAALPETLAALDAQWKLVLVTLVTLVLTALLYNLNIPLIRLYEGYLWADSWIGRRRASHYVARLAAARARWDGMRTLLRALPAQDPRYKKIFDYWNEIGRRINRDFPLDSPALPTRLGNVIRGFEDYPKRQYAISAIPLWPRLISKIDKDYAAATDEEKSSFDFMLNCSALSAILAALILFGSLARASAPDTVRWGWRLGEVALFVLVSHLSYRAAVDAALAWGEMVKGSFDLYRWDLLKQLGFTQPPKTMEEERELWGNISQQMVFGDTPTVPLAVYAPLNEPEPVALKTARGVSKPATDGSVLVTLRVENVDAGKREATDVVITDSPPSGWDYEWGSASIVGGSRTVDVSGLNPYHFNVGNLKHGEDVTLTYRTIRLKD